MLNVNFKSSVKLTEWLFSTFGLKSATFEASPPLFVPLPHDSKGKFPRSKDLENITVRFFTYY